MKDLLSMAYEIHEKGQTERGAMEAFAEEFLEELKKLKGTDISPYLSCQLDVVHMNYIVKLTIPTTANIFNTCGSD